MERRPNLLYVFADQLRRSSCGYTGYQNARTPNIDALHADSMDFCQAVSGHPVCAPYRASLVTGKYTTSAGLVTNEIRLNPNQRCIGHVLTEGGYETAYIGKWHLYANEMGSHYNPKNSFVPRGPDRLGYDDYWAAYGFHHEYYAPCAYYHEESPQKIYADKYEPYSQTELAIKHLRRLRCNGIRLFMSGHALKKARKARHCRPFLDTRELLFSFLDHKTRRNRMISSGFMHIAWDTRMTSRVGQVMSMNS